MLVISEILKGILGHWGLVLDFGPTWPGAKPFLVACVLSFIITSIDFFFQKKKISFKFF